ncbi:hypothetical protein LINPERHAP1_LOCUS14848 [Linum perenne]
MKEGDKPILVSLTMAEFWVQLCGLPRSFLIEPVAKAIGGFIGTYMKSDEALHGSVGDEFLRVRVRMDVRQPLKREKKIKKQVVLLKFANSDMKNCLPIATSVG